MKSVRLALLLFTVFAVAAFGGTGVMGLTGSGEECPPPSDSPAPPPEETAPPAPEEPAGSDPAPGTDVPIEAPAAAGEETTPVDEVVPAPAAETTEPEPEAPKEPDPAPEPDCSPKPDAPKSGKTRESEKPAKTPEKVDGESQGHGQIVSTVARCAPRGKDAVFGTDAFAGFKNHGAFVRRAAHGESLSLGGTSYDLSQLSGAEALCAAFAKLGADKSKSAEDPDSPGAKKDKSKKPKRGRSGRPS